MARTAIRYDPAEFINTREEATAYLKAAAEGEDPEVLDAALSDIVRAAHSNRKEETMASKELEKLAENLQGMVRACERLARKSAIEGTYANALMYIQESNAYAKAAEMAYAALAEERGKEKGMSFKVEEKDTGTDWRNVEDKSKTPEAENEGDCEGCYWWDPCPCRKCDYGVCGNKESIFHGDYTSATRTCTSWEE